MFAECGGTPVPNLDSMFSTAVTLKLDHYTNSHVQGLVRIVHAAKEETGGILVGGEHKVITHSGSKFDYWVPYDKYCAVSKKDAKLQVERELVLSGAYNSAQKITIFSKLHKLLIDSTS
jgi:hypothetical protein